MTNPYPGPRPFTASEDGLFAGREHEIAELTSLVISHQVVLLYAQSGAGKTSVVNAGVTPSLRDKGIRLLPIARMSIPLPNDVPIDEIANVFVYSAVGDLFPEVPNRDLWRLKSSLTEVFDRLPQCGDDSGEPELVVFVLDQFEEIFSAYPQRWADRVKFFSELSEALRTHRELRVLCVLREDFLAAFNEFAHLLPEGGRTRYHLERLRETEAVAAIKRPLEQTSRSFATGVSEAMVHDLMSITVVSPFGEVVRVPGEFVEPVQLQVVCFTLFERLPAESHDITFEDYQKYGNPDEALESFYQKALKATLAVAGVDERKLRDWFESQLITSAGTRGLVFQDREYTGGISNAVVDVLEQRHLVRPEVRSGSRWYELTHDRFIRPIQKANREWRSIRWSQSVESYTEVVHRVVNLTGVAENLLRDFLGSLQDSTIQGPARTSKAIPPEALSLLVDAGLLRRDLIDGSETFLLANDSVGQTVQFANQGWRASNWSQTSALRDFEGRAARWANASSDASAMLLDRTDLREASAIVWRARASGVVLRDELLTYIESSRRSEWAVKIRWLQYAALVFVLAGLVALALPETVRFRSPLLHCGAAGLGAVFMIARQKEDDELLLRGVGRFVMLLVVGGASGLMLSFLPNNIPTILAVPVAVVAGFFGIALLLEVARPATEGTIS